MSAARAATAEAGGVSACPCARPVAHFHVAVVDGKLALVVVHEDAVCDWPLRGPEAREVLARAGDPRGAQLTRPDANRDGRRPTSASIGPRPGAPLSV